MRQNKTDKQVKLWCGDAPTTCQVCGGAIGDVFYDVPIRGTWGLACSFCRVIHNPKMGQMYDTNTLLKIKDLQLSY